MTVDFLTPVGRLVQGDVFNPQDKDPEGRPLTIRTGPNAGQQKVQYFIRVAIPKSDPGWPALEAKIKSEAKIGFPQFFGPQGECLAPRFAWKFVDGDSAVPNQRGVKPCDCEGFAGCWVLSMTTQFAPKAYRKGGSEIITDPNEIKSGYYIRVYGTIAANGSVQQPGVFVNQSMVELVGYGPEIKNGPDAKSIFASQAENLPVGMSPTPVAPESIIAVPPPAWDYLQPETKTYLVQGKQYTKEQLLQFGWSEEQISNLK